MDYPPFDYSHLTVHERLRLIGDIWDSIAKEAEADPGIMPLTDEQRAELERDPESAVPWEEALDGIERRLRDARYKR